MMVVLTRSSSALDAEVRSSFRDRSRSILRRTMQVVVHHSPKLSGRVRRPRLTKKCCKMSGSIQMLCSMPHESPAIAEPWLRETSFSTSVQGTDFSLGLLWNAAFRLRQLSLQKHVETCSE